LFVFVGVLAVGVIVLALVSVYVGTTCHGTDLAGGGMRGLLYDSAIRGPVVTALQRHGVIVVNHPHAASNPDGGAGNRLNPSRVEKSQLRHIHTHVNAFGEQVRTPHLRRWR
jgi:hypothetical protein